MRWFARFLLISASLSVSAASADTITLVSGKKIHGILIERTNLHVRLQTPDGEITIPAGEVESIEFDAPPGDPTASRPAEAESKPTAAGAGGREEAHDADDAKAIRKIQGKWMRLIRAIRSNYLESNSEKSIEEGRKRLSAIKDPLAILPLTQTLGPGNLTCRRVMIETLARFPEDESTLNLAALGLIERDPDLRRAIFTELVRRKEPRVVSQYREALDSDNDKLIRNAAIALGAMKSRPAIPDLIDALTANRRKVVDVPVTSYFGGLQSAFSGETDVGLGFGRRVRHLPVIGVTTAGAFTSVENRRERQEVTMFRTEVLEALKQITGQNHGFDAAAWRRWHEEQSP